MHTTSTWLFNRAYFSESGDHFGGVDTGDTKEISIYRKFINLKITMDLQNPLYLLPAFNTAFTFLSEE